jgi:hypothetical protein
MSTAKPILVFGSLGVCCDDVTKIARASVGREALSARLASFSDTSQDGFGFSSTSIVSAHSPFFVVVAGSPRMSLLAFLTELCSHFSFLRFARLSYAGWLTRFLFCFRLRLSAGVTSNCGSNLKGISRARLTRQSRSVFFKESRARSRSSNSGIFRVGRSTISLITGRAFSDCATRRYLQIGKVELYIARNGAQRGVKHPARAANKSSSGVQRPSSPPNSFGAVKWMALGAESDWLFRFVRNSTMRLLHMHVLRFVSHKTPRFQRRLAEKGRTHGVLQYGIM